jgi:hypothetical protein
MSMLFGNERDYSRIKNGKITTSELDEYFSFYIPFGIG